MIVQFLANDRPEERLEKLRRLAEEVGRLDKEPAHIFSAPPGFGRVRRIYVDPATNELVVLTDGGAERRYAAVP